MVFVEDGDLANEMIRLLGQELKQLRSQLQEAEGSTQRSEGSGSSSSMERINIVEGENAKLKARIKALELESAQARLAPGNNAPGKLDKGDQLSEKDRLLKKKDEDISRLQEAIKLYKEKITTEKASIAALQKRFDEAQEQASQLKHECDKAGNWVLNPEQEKQCFNYQNFLVSGPRISRPSEIQASPRELVLREDTKIKLSTSGLRTIQFSDKQIIWSSDTISRAIAIRPLHHYYIDGPEDEWQHSVTNRPLAAGQKCVIFYGHKGWAYMGSYECVQAAPLDLEQYKTLPLNIKKYAISRTVISPGQISPLVSNLVEGIYAQGILKVECLAFKFLSFDGILNKKLLKDSGVVSSSEGTAIHVPGIESYSKRSAADDISYHKPHLKKRRV